MPLTWEEEGEIEGEEIRRPGTITAASSCITASDAGEEAGQTRVGIFEAEETGLGVVLGVLLIVT